MPRLRAVLLAALFILLVPPTRSWAAPDSGIILELPEVTRERTFTLRGQTLPGSDVTVGSTQVKADPSGYFQAKLTLANEGMNDVAVSVMTPEGRVLTWTGFVELDTNAPRLIQRLPEVTNRAYYKVTGRTELGARVEVNGQAVPVDAGGYFSTWVSLDKTPAIKQVITDPAGNQTVAERTIQVVKTSPLYYTWAPYVGVIGSAKAGTKVSDAVDPDAPVTIVEGDEQFRWIQPLDLGWKDLWLKFEPPTGAPYYHHYIWYRPVAIDFPVQTNLAKLSLPGHLNRGWRLVVNDQPIEVDANGRFTVSLDLKVGDNMINMMLYSPEDGASSYTVRVNRTSWSEATGFKDGNWMFTITDPPGYRFWLRNQPKGEIVIGPEGRQLWPIQVVPGLNRVWIDSLWPTGTVRSLYYEFTYAPGRVVKMQLDRPSAMVNDQEQALAVPPQLIDGNTYVPLRALADALGAKLTWDAATRTAHFELGAKRLSVTLDSHEAQVNGQARMMTAPARLVSERTMVPLRFISENLGAQVKWDGATRGITIILP